MVQHSKDLWGELELTDFEDTPVSILKEQASLLDEKTQNVLRGEILSQIFTSGDSKSKKERILHIFNVLIPGLKNRRSELLRIAHDPQTYFPVDMEVRNDKNERYKAETLESFEKKLSEILSNPETKEFLQNLIAELKIRKVASGGRGLKLR